MPWHVGRPFDVSGVGWSEECLAEMAAEREECLHRCGLLDEDDDTGLGATPAGRLLRLARALAASPGGPMADSLEVEACFHLP